MRDNDLGECEDEEMDYYDEKLKEASRRLCKQRRREKREKQNQLLEELWEAWRGRRLSEVQRLVTVLSNSKFGPKKRFFRT